MRRSLTKSSRFNWARLVEMRDCAKPRISCNSATVSSSCISKSINRSRNGSDNARRDFMIDDMQRINIFAYEDT